MRKSALALSAIPLAFIVLAAGAAAAKSKKPREKYYLDVVQVDTANGVPEEIADRLETTLAAVLAKRGEFVPTLEGAPDMAAAPDDFKKWLQKKKIRAFAVTVRVTAWEREVLPPKEGKTGQILKQHIAVSLVGTAMPGDVLALGGDGMATVATEVGRTIRPADERYVVGAAIEEALQRAVQNAVEALGSTPASKPATGGKRRKPAT